MSVKGDGFEPQVPGKLITDKKLFQRGVAFLVASNHQCALIDSLPHFVVLRQLNGKVFGTSIIALAIVSVFEQNITDALETSGVDGESLIPYSVWQEKVLLGRCTSTFASVCQGVLSQEAFAVALVRLDDFRGFTGS